MPRPWNLAKRTIGVRHLMVGIAFLAMVLALVLQERRSRHREAQLRQERDQARYELAYFRARMLSEQVQRREMSKRFPEGFPTATIAATAADPPPP